MKVFLSHKLIFIIINIVEDLFTRARSKGFTCVNLMKHFNNSHIRLASAPFYRAGTPASRSLCFSELKRQLTQYRQYQLQQLEQQGQLSFDNSLATCSYCSSILERTSFSRYSVIFYFQEFTQTQSPFLCMILQAHFSSLHG